MSAIPWGFIVRQGPDPGRRVAVPSEVFVIGSSPECALQFPANFVRERHAEVRRVNGTFEVMDLTGANLVWVDGRPVTHAVLFSGTVLRVGRLELLLVSLDDTASAIPDSTERSLPRLTFEQSPNADVPRSGELAALKATPLGRTSAPEGSGQHRQSDVPSTTSGRFSVGDVIDGRYRITDRIATGGMGEVYRAEHVELGKALALKVMLPTLNADQEFVNRFKIEAVAASRIGHPNIVDISDFGRTADGRFYFAMEFLDGLTLSSLVHRNGAQAPARAVNLILQASRALAAAHELHIVHRDLKPDNVMVLQRPGNPDLVKVLDFGVARVEVNKESISNTATGIVVGTPQYMSPEQAKAIVVDNRSDIDSLGLILYELLAGKPAFTGETPPIVMVKQVTENPEPLPDYVPEDLSELVMQMLEKEPSARPQRMTEVVERLDVIRRALRTDAFEPKASGVVHERTPTPARQLSGRRLDPKTPARASTPAREGTPRPASQKQAPLVVMPAPTVVHDEAAPVHLEEAAPRPLADGDPSEEELAALHSKPKWPLALAVSFVAAVLIVGAIFFLTSPTADVPPQVVEVAAPAPARPAVVSMTVRSDPDGAEVSVGGALLGKTPVPLTRDQGTELDLSVSLPGYEPRQQRVLFSGDVTDLVITLTKAAPPDEAPKAEAMPPAPSAEVKPIDPTGKNPAPRKTPPAKPAPTERKPSTGELKDVPF